MPHAVVDHLVYGAPTLESGVGELLRATGVEAAFGGRHPGRGTQNALVSLGPRTYLEVLAPDPDDDGDEAPAFGIATMGVPGLRAWAAAPDDLEAAVAAARAHGLDYGGVVAGERTTPDGRELRWRMTSRLPGEDGVAVLPFLIDWGDGPHPAATAPPGLTLLGLRVLTPEPAAVERTLRALGAEVAVSEAASPSLEAELDGPAGRVVLVS